jgi:hypothetical protein
MKLHEVSRFIKSNPDTIVQLMTLEDCRFITICVPAIRLYNDWMSDAPIGLPENGELVLMCTFYADNKAYPLEDEGFSDGDFESLMRAIEGGIKSET